MKYLSSEQNRHWMVVMHAAILFILLALTGCQEKVSPGTAEVKRPSVSGVTTAELKVSPVDDYYESSGTIKAKNIGVISSRIMGSVTSIAVQEGQRVSQGQILLTIDNSDAAQRAKAAENAVESARQQKQLADVTFSRYARLYEAKALSRQEFDQVEAQRKIAGSEFERAQAMLKEAQTYKGYATLRAPFTGIVTGRKIDPGSMAMPGMQLMTVEDTSKFLVEVPVDERLSAKLKVGDPVDMSVDALDLNMKCKVSEVVPSVDPMSRTFIVKVATSGQGLRTGLYAKIRIPTGKKEALIVPISSIVEKGQLNGVYSVDAKGIISYRLVRMGKRFGSSVEIISGLNAGDKIIVAGTDKAIDGGVTESQKPSASEKKQ
ncbi:MAG TPA: efflux RND transporter periplasmic adaptor subunit [Dissulfurispiraceae bacterium]|nr:efflux RND transporter periplasmic adaptor subunit [Dissulfurispiraceae bacterium]